MGKQDLHPKPPPPKITWRTFIGEKNPVVDKVGAIINGDDPNGFFNKQKPRSYGFETQPADVTTTVDTPPITQEENEKNMIPAEGGTPYVNDKRTVVEGGQMKDINVYTTTPQVEPPPVPKPEWNDKGEIKIPNKTATIQEQTNAIVFNTLNDMGLDPTSDMGIAIGSSLSPIVEGFQQIKRGENEKNANLMLVDGVLGLVKAGIGMMPQMMGVNLTIPMMTEVGGSVAETLGLDRSQGEKIGQMVSFAPFGKAVMLAGLVSDTAGEFVHSILKDKDIDEINKERIIETANQIGFFTGLGMQGLTKKVYNTVLKSNAFDVKKLTPQQIDNAMVNQIQLDRYDSVIRSLEKDKEDLQKQINEAKTPEDRLKAVNTLDKVNEKQAEYREKRDNQQRRRATLEVPEQKSYEDVVSEFNVAKESGEPYPLPKESDISDVQDKGKFNNVSYQISQHNLGLAKSTGDLSLINPEYVNMEFKNIKGQVKKLGIEMPKPKEPAIEKVKENKVNDEKPPQEKAPEPVKTEPVKVEPPPPVKTEPVVKKEEPVKPEPVVEPPKVEEPPNELTRKGEEGIVAKLLEGWQKEKQKEEPPKEDWTDKASKELKERNAKEKKERQQKREQEPVRKEEPPKRITAEEIKLKNGKWEITDPVDGSKTSFSTYAEAEKYLKRAKPPEKDYPDLSKETNAEIKEHKVRARKYKTANEYIEKVLKIPIKINRSRSGYGAVGTRDRFGNKTYTHIEVPNKKGLLEQGHLWHEVGHIIDNAKTIIKGRGKGNYHAKLTSGEYSNKYKSVLEKFSQYIHDNTHAIINAVRVRTGDRKFVRYTSIEEVMNSPLLNDAQKKKNIEWMTKTEESNKAYRNQGIELFANGFKEYVLNPEKMLKEAPELHAMYEQVFKESPQLKDFYEYEASKDIVRNVLNKDSGISFGGLSKLNDLVDAKTLKAIYTIAKYNLFNENGVVRTYGRWAREMLNDIGDKIRPRLKELWNGLTKDRTGLRNAVTQGFNIGKKTESVEPDYSQFKRGGQTKQPTQQEKGAINPNPTPKEVERAKKIVVRDVLKNGKKTEEFVNAIAPMKNAKMHQKDIIWKMKGDKEKFRQEVDMMYDDIGKKIEKMSQKEQIAIFDKLKRGQKQDTPELQAFADLHRKIDNMLWQEINKYRPLNWIANHFRIFMKKPEQEVPLSISSRRNMEGEGGKWKRMTLFDMSAWVERGIEPISYNPVVNAKLDYSSKMKFITANRMLENFIKSGDAVYVKPKDDPPVGYKKIDDAISNTYFGSRKGGYYFEPNVARLLNNYLSQDLIRQTKWGNFFFSIKNSTTAVELAIPTFHLLFETAEATSSQIARGFRRALNVGVLKANPLEFIKGIGEIATSPLASVTLAKAGNKVFRYLKNPIDFAKSDFGKEVLKQFPDFERYVDDMFTGGMRLGMHDIDVRGLPKVLGKVMHPLFNVYIPRLKAGAFLHEFGLALKEHEKSLNSGAITRGELARRSLNFVEDRFGEMNWDNLMLNHTLKSALQLTFRSVTWKTGDVRGLIGAVPEQIRGIKNLTGSEKANVSQRMAWLVGLAVTHGIMSAVTQYAFIGETPQDYRDLLAPRYDKTDPEKRISLPTYVKDVVHLIKDIPSFVTSSMSGFLGKAYELWYNRDFFGYNIYNPRHPVFIPDGVDNWYETQFLESMWHLLPKPFAVGNLLSNSDMSNLKERFIQMGTVDDFPDFVSKYGGFAGLQKAPRVLSRTSMQNEIDTLYNKRYGGGTKSYEQKEEATLKANLRALLKSNPAEFERQSDEAVKEGKLTAKQVLNLSGNKVPVDVYLFRFLPDSDKEYLFNKMTPEEKELYGQGIAKESLRKKLGLPERKEDSPKTLKQMKNRLNKKSNGGSLKELKDKYK